MCSLKPERISGYEGFGSPRSAVSAPLPFRKEHYLAALEIASPKSDAVVIFFIVLRGSPPFGYCHDATLA